MLRRARVLFNGGAAAPAAAAAAAGDSGVSRPFFSRAAAFVKQHWFPLGIPCTMAFTLWQPQLLDPGSATSSGGLLRSAVWRDALIPTIFLCAGLGVNLAAMASALAVFRVHLFVQLLGFAVCPIVGVLLFWGGSLAMNPNFSLLLPIATTITTTTTTAAAIGKVIADPPASAAASTNTADTRGVFGLRREFIIGGLFVCCLPTTIGLSTACARAVGANVPVTIVNSVLGNFIGVAVTPLLFCQLTSIEASMDIGSVFKKLSLSVLLPLGAGIALRQSGLLATKRANVIRVIEPYLGAVQQGCILTMLGIVISQNSDKVKSTVQPREVPSLLATIMLLYAIFFHLGLALSRPCLPGADSAMRVAATLSGTQKTGAMGLSIATLLFQNDPALPLITFPLLCFHPSQVALSTMMAQNALRRKWFGLIV